MGSRIITLQRQARELGRLRNGYTDHSGTKPRPVKSKTWIITSHAEHYVTAAADIWGGTPEQWQPLGNGAQQWRVVTDAPTLDAILPPGDPLSQCYESWSKGGAQRRCDGMTETLSDSPCVCRAQWGDDFHEIAPREAACKVTTRLNVILPEMPDIGAWRVETHSYYAANEMAAAVDVIKGSIGTDALIPISLRIEQRTRVAQGKTKQFPVIAVELRGATAGQILAGAAPVAVEGGKRAALAAGGPAYVELIRAAASRDEVLLIWEQAKQAAVPNAKEIEAAAKARVQELLDQVADEAGEPDDAEESDEDTAPPPPAPNKTPDELWADIVNAAGEAWTTSALRDAFAERNQGEDPSTASAEQLNAFLWDLTNGWVKAPAGAERSPF
jgi:hypothetical protein